MSRLGGHIFRRRRGFMVGLAALAAMAVADPGRAGDESGTLGATTLIERLADELTRLFSAGRSRSDLVVAFDRMLAEYADMAGVAAVALGPAWRSASAEERAAFVPAFQAYLSRKYGGFFARYRDAEVRVGGTHDKGRAGVMVKTRFIRFGERPVPVEWQVASRGGRPRVVNIIIEGVSMLASEREEIALRLEKAGGSVAGLAADLAGT